MAALCRSVCGLIRLFRSDGQVRCCEPTCLLTIRSFPSRLKRRFRLLMNNGASGAPPRSRSHSGSAPTLSRLSGVARSLRPLPRHWTCHGAGGGREPRRRRSGR